MAYKIKKNEAEKLAKPATKSILWLVELTNDKNATVIADIRIASKKAVKRGFNRINFEVVLYFANLGK